MRYGLIGYPLGHSYSPEIHRFLLNEDYKLCPLKPEEVAPFLAKRDFLGLNVTIPYKQTVMPYLDEISAPARRIGAVNCIVNRSGRLYGYNTDYSGFMEMLKDQNIEVSGRRVAVLGSGGAAKSCRVALEDMGASPVLVSRSEKPDAITYDQLYAEEASYACLVNATPVGMFPNDEESPVDLSRFHKLESCVDVIYNPMRTHLRFDAKQKGLKSTGGLQMLVRQAFAADEFFTGTKMDPAQIQPCLRDLLRRRRNLVLIGMPTSGKTTVCKLLSIRSGREYVEMDDVLEQRLRMSIRECFDTRGEADFRSMEAGLAKELKAGRGCIISTGGGIVKNPDNMRYLSENGLVLWIDRDPRQLFPSSSRPLSADREAVQKLYEERRGLYERYSDYVIDNRGNLSDTLRQILAIAGE